MHQFPDWNYIEDTSTGLRGLERFLDNGRIAADILRTFDEVETWCWMIRIWNEETQSNRVVASYDDNIWYPECESAYDACIEALIRFCPTEVSRDESFTITSNIVTKRSFLRKIISVGLAASLTMSAMIALTGCNTGSAAIGGSQRSMEQAPYQELMGGRYQLIDAAPFSSVSTFYAYEDVTNHTVWFTIDYTDGSSGHVERAGYDLVALEDAEGKPITVSNYWETKENNINAQLLAGRWAKIDEYDDNRYTTCCVYEDVSNHTIWFSVEYVNASSGSVQRAGYDLIAMVKNDGSPMTADEYWNTKAQL